MTNRRKFSVFISSTYEDLKEERQALFGVALENNFIPVGMEQFPGMRRQVNASGETLF